MMFPIDYNGDVLNHNARVGVDGGIVESTDFLADFSEQTKRVNMPLLLDIYPNAAAAYSLRKLRTAYTGAAIRVRRSSDNTETDIGFNNAGDLDTSALMAFVGNGNGFVRTWYDQSGSGNNVIQTGTTAQPVVVSGGTILLDGGKPIIGFDGVSHHLFGNTNTSQEGFVFSVFNIGENEQFRLSQANPSNDTTSFSVDTISSSSVTNIRFLDLNGVGNNIRTANTNSITNLRCLATYSSNSSTWVGWVNSVLQTLVASLGSNVGTWFGDVQYPLFIQRLNRLTSINNKANVQEIIIYNSNQSPNRIGIETNINSYYRIYQQEALLLDYYPDAAAAYSLRKLRSGYTGAAIQVRRSSDNAVQNIGFDSNGGLDTTALTTFVGTGNTGFVTTWYDQSGNNRNATQTTQADQPQIVRNGLILTVNSKPCIYPLAVAGMNMGFNDSNLGTVNKHIFVVADTTRGENNTANYQSVLISSYSGSGSLGNDFAFSYYHGEPTIRLRNYDGSSFVLNSGTTSGYKIWQTIRTSSLLYIADNNNPYTVGGTPNTVYNSNTYRIGGYVSAGVNNNPKLIQEVIYYPSNQSKNRPLIEANINSYYNIYPSDSDANVFVTAAALTDTTQIQAVNKLVTDLKGYGLWGKMKAIYPFVGGTAASHKFNLKDPRDVDGAFRLVFSGGMTHNSNGITGNGTDAYFDTIYNVQTQASLNNMSLSAYSRTNLARSLDVFFSTVDGNTNAIYLNPRNVNNEMRAKLNSTTDETLTTSISSSLGLYILNRTSSTQVKIYNNTTTYTYTSNSTATQNSNLYGLRFQTSGYSQRNMCFMHIGDGLTDTEAANLYTAVQTFQTTLGRQV